MDYLSILYQAAAAAGRSCYEDASYECGGCYVRSVAGTTGRDESCRGRKEGGSQAKAGKEEVKGRLPIYFGQIGLSKKQEDDVRKAAQPFDEKVVHLRKQIADLDKQIDDLDAEKVAACEKVLTEGQKTALMARRDQAEAEKAARRKKAANGDGAKTEEPKP